MLWPADTDHKVRATRAYLAGFGTSGSLLAGAAVMFVLASAIVGFHGWPQVGPQSPIANVAAPNVTISPSSRASRILAALSAHAQAATTRSAPAITQHGQALGAGSTGQTPSGSAPGIGTRGSVASCSGSGCATSLPGPASTITGAVSQAVAGTGAKVSSAVSSASNAAANVVAPVSPAAANTLRRIGHGTAQSVNGASKSVAGAVSGLAHP